MRRTVAEILVATLESMELAYPQVSPEAQAELAAAKAELEAE